jgi:O-antigen ligase
MSYNSPNTGPKLQVRQSPWSLLLLITVVFLLSYHHLSNAQNPIGDYNGTQDELIDNVVNGSLIHRAAILLLGIASIISLARHRASGRLRIEGLLGWLFLTFATLAFLSPIWAEDLTLTLRRVLAFGILWIAAVAVVQRATLRDIILWIFFSTLLFLLIGIAAEILFGNFHPFVSGYRFAGTLHPNYQGMQCGLCLLSALAAADGEKHWRTSFLACGFIAFVFLILSGSRSALAGALLAIVVYVLAVSSRPTKIAAALSFSIIVSSVLLFLIAGLSSDLKRVILLGREDQDSAESFSGRTMIWVDLGYYIRQRPILGYGYGGFWTPAHISAISDEEKQGIPTSHSTYIEYLLYLGPIGLAVYGLLLFVATGRALLFYRLSRDSAFAFCGALIAFCALNGFAEYVMIEGAPLMFPCMVVLAWLAFVPFRQTPWIDCGSGRRPSV